MISPEAWQAFAGVAAIIILLGGVALALQRLGIIGRAAPAPPAPAPAPEPEDLVELRTRVAVLEERTRKHEISLEGIGRLHARVDEVKACISRIEGEVSGMSRQVNLVVKHLLKGDES